MHTVIKHLTYEELEGGLERIRQSPKNSGTLKMIVARPEENQRSILEEAQLGKKEGLVGDSWAQRGSSRTSDGSAHPDMQLNIMNSRVAQLVAQYRDRWCLAGDQLYVDLDISEENLPAGTHLEIGSSIVKVTDQPHTGCSKFVERFGLDAVKFVNAKPYRHLHLRGINARVVESGKINQGDTIRVIR